jgi:hypothetical protein
MSPKPNRQARRLYPVMDAAGAEPWKAGKPPTYAAPGRSQKRAARRAPGVLVDMPTCSRRQSAMRASLAGCAGDLKAGYAPGPLGLRFRGPADEAGFSTAAQNPREMRLARIWSRKVPAAEIVVGGSGR